MLVNMFRFAGHIPCLLHILPCLVLGLSFVLFCLGFQGVFFFFLTTFYNVKTILSSEAYKNRLGPPGGCGLQPTDMKRRMSTDMKRRMSIILSIKTSAGSV